MLIALIGYRFGREPERRLDEIRAERGDYMRRFVRLAGIDARKTVLELGPGCGFGTRVLAEAAREVIACDISPAFLAVARQELADLDTVTFHEVRSRDLSPVAEGSIDAVVSVSVFIHLNLYDIYLYFIEFKRILKNKGKVVFDFADEHRISGPMRIASLRGQFLEHVPFYGERPESLPGLVQWNSARGIRNVARLAGFRPAGRRGNKLRFVKWGE